MSKPREFWVTKDLFAYGYDHIEDASGKALGYVHVIEKSAYDEAVKQAAYWKKEVDALLTESLNLLRSKENDKLTAALKIAKDALSNNCQLTGKYNCSFYETSERCWTCEALKQIEELMK